MDAKPSKRRPTRSGFTLVELLVVIIIISMLAGMLAVALPAAIRAARRATISSEITQLSMALDKYKSDCGDYPPDCFATPNLASDMNAQNEILRHFRKRFPRYRPGVSGLGGANNWVKFKNDIIDAYDKYDTANDPDFPSEYKVNVDLLTPASALTFLLGGLPDQDGKPSGFSANPNNPFLIGGSRTAPLFEFDETRYTVTNNVPLYVPKHIKNPANSSEGVPYAYFRARSGGYGAAPADIPYVSITDSGTSFPYAQKVDSSSSKIDWYKPKSFQIIAAGLDGEFGDSSITPPLANNAQGWANVRAFNSDDNNLKSVEDDNLSSFTSGRLEDGAQ